MVGKRSPCVHGECVLAHEGNVCVHRRRFYVQEECVRLHEKRTEKISMYKEGVFVVYKEKISVFTGDVSVSEEKILVHTKDLSVYNRKCLCTRRIFKF